MELDQATVLKGLIIAILSYYLLKGILCLLLWQVTSKMEEKGLEKQEEAKKFVMEKRRLREQEQEELRQRREGKKYY